MCKIIANPRQNHTGFSCIFFEFLFYLFQKPAQVFDTGFNSFQYRLHSFKFNAYRAVIPGIFQNGQTLADRHHTVADDGAPQIISASGLEEGGTGRITRAALY